MTKREALKALVDEMEYVLSCINEDKVPFDGDDFHEALRLGKEALAKSEQEKERCVGCEACIDTACGRDECPKGWPKAAQPEQEPVAWMQDTTCGLYVIDHPDEWHCIPLYTTPPAVTESHKQRSDNKHLEPVAIVEASWNDDEGFMLVKRLAEKLPKGSQLYTTPPQRTWVHATPWRGLTEEDWDYLNKYCGSIRSAIQTAETLLKEKNT